MTTHTAPALPHIVPRAEHVISRAHISPNALTVLYRLRHAGYRACLVGGGVRDLLLGLRPKDFDVATDAHPDAARTTFRNGRLIGRRFRLLHVYFGHEIIEVATFRASSSADCEEDGPTVEQADDGRILSDNVYGTIEQDAYRRDFTINALYYDIADFSVLDYVGGLADLKDGIIRVIGDPVQRYHEDPVRLLRAVRFAAKLDFTIAPETAAPLFALSHLLEKVPAPRLLDEVLKLFFKGAAVHTFEQLRQYGLFGGLFPQTEACLREPDGHTLETFLMRAFANTDRRVAARQPVHAAFLYAVLLWGPVCAEQKRRHIADPSLRSFDLLRVVGEHVLRTQTHRTALQRRFHPLIFDIWTLQLRLHILSGKKPLQLISAPNFRAGYDFLLLRAAADASDTTLVELADWWTHFLGLDDAGKLKFLEPPKPGSKPSKKKKRRTKPAKNTQAVVPEG